MKAEIVKILRDPRLKLPQITNFESVASQILVYLQEWKRWNSKINLTAEQDEISVVRKHFFDSLLYSQGLAEGNRIIDIGSGAGFPGIPLKLVFPDLQLTLVESKRKRANFLNQIVRMLQLKSVHICHQRAEDLGEDMQELFDAALFRYVQSLEQCVELAEPILRPGGRIIMIKEPDYTGSVADPGTHMALINEFPVEGYTGVSSKLMIYEKCFT